MGKEDRPLPAAFVLIEESPQQGRTVCTEPQRPYFWPSSGIFVLMRHWQSESSSLNLNLIPKDRSGFKKEKKKS